MFYFKILICPLCPLCLWLFYVPSPFSFLKCASGGKSRLEFLSFPNTFKFRMSTQRVWSSTGHTLSLVSPALEDTTSLSLSPENKALRMLCENPLLFISDSPAVRYLSLCCFCLFRFLTDDFRAWPLPVLILSSPPKPPSWSHASNPWLLVTLAVTLAPWFSNYDGDGII